MIDLHLHTTYSDGRRSSTEMVATAAEKGVQAIAITDHDVLDGVEEAQSAGQRLGVDVVPGIEMTAAYGPRVVHVLGYEVDIADPPLRQALARGRAQMDAHVTALLEEIEQVAPGLTREHLDGYRSRYPGGASLILSLVQHRVLTKMSPKEGLRLLRLAAQEPRAYSVAEAVTLIHGAGGVASLAHPARLQKAQPLMGRNDLAPLASQGIDALEAWQWIPGGWGAEHYQRVAEELQLLVTGGSDDHGAPTAAGTWRLGSQAVPDSVLVQIRKRAAQYRLAPDRP